LNFYFTCGNFLIEKRESLMEKGNELKRLEEENQRLRRALEEVSILNEIAMAVSSTLSLDRILDLVVQKSLKHLKAEQGAVLLLDEKKEDKPFQTMIRGWDTSTHNLPFRLDTQLSGWMLKNRQPLLSNDFSRDNRFFTASNEPLPVRSLLCVPLILKARMIGLVSLFNKKSAEGFSQEDQRLMSIIAAQSAQIIENARLLKEEQQLIKMQEELRLAYEIQTNLLPENPPKVKGYDIYGKSIPAKTVGGDYYDFIPVDDNRLAFCLGDVSGKGMPAALLMANLQATIRGQAVLDLAIPEILANANRLLFQNTSSEKFATLFFGILDHKNHELTYSNAGHNYPLRITENNRLETVKEGGIVLGCLESFSFPESKLSFEINEILVLYSDGITEAVNEQGDEFGEDQLSELIFKNQTRPARDIVEIILREAEQYAGNLPQTDDMTLMVVKRIG
jgi:sigma-B regulation protein RsbU (phosphoserine phosphatase)